MVFTEPMRRLVASMVGGGGIIAAVTFFLPWIAVSCDGQPITTVSPMQRAQGFNATDGLDENTELPAIEINEQVTAENIYWLFLILPLSITAIGLYILISSAPPKVPLTFAGLICTILGIAMTTKRGLLDHLELQFDVTLSPQWSLETHATAGPWLAIAGYALALSGALITLVARKDLD